MATLDVNDAFDPSFIDTIVVLRRVQIINSAGRVQLSVTSTSTGAVVIAASPNDLQRLPDYEMMQKAIRVTSPVFRLQGPSVDEVGTVTMPDQILWHNSMYVVVSLDDYSEYGRGFTSAVCISVTQPDPPVFPSPVGNA